VKSVRRLSGFLKPYWLWATLAPLLMMLEVAMDLTQPWMFQQIIDNGVAQLDMDYVLKSGALMIVFAFIGAIGGIGCGIYAIKAAQGFGADVRAAMFGQVQSLSFGNLDKLGTGQIITRLTNDVTQIQEAVAMLLRILVRAPLMMIGSLIMAILTAPQLIYIPLGLMLLVLVLVILIIRRAYPLFSQVQARLDALNSVMQENLAGVRVVKAFVRSDHEMRRFGAANANLMEQTMRVVKVVVMVMPMMMLILNLGTVAVLWFGGIQVIQGQMQVGQIVAFVNYLQRTLMSLLMVSMLILQLSRAAASADRVQEVIDSRPEVQDKPSAQRDFAPRGRVAFENVTFSYDGQAGDPVLKEISFVAESGQTVALLGTTGAGKSSLVHLIPRFYDVTGGRVTIDGVDVRDLDQAALRRHIGIALQEAVLFSGTIRDNIRYGRPDAGEAEVVAAARAAQAHDFIAAFPQGYDTELGQRGVNLSGGQKQRIAIARALILKPEVLILDDSTSSVDVETETKIQTELGDWMRDRAATSPAASLETCIVIAQRISTVLNADKILVLDDGRIAAEGTHNQLFAASPIYRDIYDSQLGDGTRAGRRRQ